MRHRSPRNSDFFSDLDSLSKLIHLLESSKLEFVGFVLKKLFTHFEMLIVSHALHCVNDHYFVFYLFLQSVILFW